MNSTAAPRKNWFLRQENLGAWGVKTQEKLQELRLLVIGAGGLGCPFAQTLARMGARHITFVDPDVVEGSNLHRQVLFGQNSLGQPKATTALSALRRDLPWFEGEAHILACEPDTIQRLLNPANEAKRPHLVVDATDSVSCKLLVHAACAATGIPFLYSSATGLSGQVALFEHSPGQACLECLRLSAGAEDFRSHQLSDNRNCATVGVLGLTTSAVAQVMVDLVCTWLNTSPAQHHHTNKDSRLSKPPTLHCIEVLPHSHQRIQLLPREGCRCHGHNELQRRQAFQERVSQEKDLSGQTREAILALSDLRSWFDRKSVTELHWVDVRDLEEVEQQPSRDLLHQSLQQTGLSLERAQWSHIPLKSLRRWLDANENTHEGALVFVCASGVRSRLALECALDRGHSQAASLKGGVSQLS